MKKIQQFKFILISLIIVIFIFHFYEPGSGYLETVDEIYSMVAGEPINASFPITFYQSAYVDYRFDPPRLRIYTLNPCLKNNQLLKSIYGKPLERHCPSAYPPAAPCVYSPYLFSIGMKTNEDLKKVTIHLGNRKVELNVQKIYKKSTEGLTVCVLPIHYYSQWQNIVLYVEAWRAQGATRFIVYFHSATKETWKTLEYYRDLGIVDIKSWPSFPGLPVDIADKYPKIDDSTFILSYFLAMNICILDIKTTIGTVADFDEVMVPSNGRLLDYATKEMTGTKVGALSFENHYVSFIPRIYTSHFSGVASPKFNIYRGPPKYVFNASVLAVAQVHIPDSFVDSSMISKNADGALLHFRYDAEYKNLTTTEKPYRFFPDNHSTHIKNIEDTSHKIFNGSIPKFSSKSYDTLQECINKVMRVLLINANIRNSPVEDKVCLSIGGICKAEMDEVNDWVYDKSEPIFLVAT